MSRTKLQVITGVGLALAGLAFVANLWRSLDLAKERIKELELHLTLLDSENQDAIARLSGNAVELEAQRALNKDIHSLRAKYHSFKELQDQNVYLKNVISAQAKESARLMGMILHTDVPPSEMLPRETLKILSPGLYPNIDLMFERFLGGASDEELMREFRMSSKHPYFQNLLRERGITKGLLPEQGTPTSQ